MNQDMSIVSLVLHASFVVQIVMAILLAISVASWAAIIRKITAIKRIQNLNEEFERVFWSGTSLNELFSAASQNAKLAGPMERIFASGMREYQKLREQVGGMFVVSETAVKYHQPARLDDALWVTARVQEAGRVSLTIAQQVMLQREGQPDALLAEGTIRIGWVDAATLKPGRIPAAILEQLKS